MAVPNDPLAYAVAEDLLEIGAVTLSPRAPYTWASGMKSPVYTDNRLTLAYPNVRAHLRNGFLQQIDRAGLRAEIVVGTATAGIPHAAWLAEALDRPMAYVRSKAKAHGKANQIEGLVATEGRAVVVEDLISTGGSSLAAVEAVQAAGLEVEAVLAIFTYGFPDAERRFADANVPYYALTTFHALVDVAEQTRRLPTDDVALLRAWHAGLQAAATSA